jgi:hypothetical protein
VRPAPPVECDRQEGHCYIGRRSSTADDANAILHGVQPRYGYGTAVPPYKKLTINVAPEIHAELQRLADEQSISITELIKRAVALHKFVWEHRHGELLIKEGDDIKQIVLL